MGVLHIAIPGSAMFPPTMRGGRKASATKLGPAHPAALLALSEAGQVGQPAISAPQHGTLQPSAHVRREAGLERTPEQDAAQEAVAALVRQCMAGDQQAWQELVASQHRRIYAICYRFTGSAYDAEDLTQDVFLKLYRNLSSFDAQKGSFQTWITTLTRNLLVDHFRRTRLDRATDSLDASMSVDDDGPTMADRLADPRPSQEHHAAGLELKVRIQQALAQLSPELREAVVLRDLEDMDYKEIAQVLSIPEGTVKSRISRGRGELARLLQRIEGQVV
jgi:RNA polymerase sigma-70 factor (ECF subfamily)